MWLTTCGPSSPTFSCKTPRRRLIHQPRDVRALASPAGAGLRNHRAQCVANVRDRVVVSACLEVFARKGVTGPHHNGLRISFEQIDLCRAAILAREISLRRHLVSLEFAGKVFAPDFVARLPFGERLDLLREESLLASFDDRSTEKADTNTATNVPRKSSQPNQGFSLTMLEMRLIVLLLSCLAGVAFQPTSLFFLQKGRQPFGHDRTHKRNTRVRHRYEAVSLP